MARVSRKSKSGAAPAPPPVAKQEGAGATLEVLKDPFSRRSFLGLAGAVVAGAALDACGIGGSSSSTTGTTTAKTGGFTLIPFYTTEDDPATMKITADAIDAFNGKHEGVKVVQIAMSNAERAQKIITGLTVGQDMGIFEVESTFRASFVDGGYLYPMDSLIKSICEDQFDLGARTIAKGHDWVMPYGAGPPVLWGRKDRVARPPKTFQEFQQFAKDNTGGGKFGVNISIGGPVAFSLEFPGWLYAFGGDIFDPQANVVFDSSQVTEAINAYLTMLKFAPPDSATWPVYNLIDAYVSERAAMAEYAGRLGSNIPSKAPKLESQTWTTPLPMGTTGVTGNVISVVAVDKKTANPELALEFIKTLLTGDTGVKYMNSVPGQLISLVKSVRDKAIADKSNPLVANHPDWWSVLNDRQGHAIEPAGPMGFMNKGTFKPYNGEPPPFGAQVWGSNPIAMQMIQKITLQSMSVKDAQAWATDQYKGIVKNYKSKNPNWKPNGGQ